MTHPDDPPRDGSGDGARSDRVPRDETDGSPLDDDAAWRAIVENYGDRADLGPTDEALPPAAADSGADAADGADGADKRSDDGPVGIGPGPSAGVFDRSFLDAAQAEREQRSAEASDRWHDEGHFVPPEPPPMPRGTPARRLAWAGLFGAPVLMLLAVVLGWSFPGWLSLLLVVSFVGGFVFLVATMERRGDDWSGDDGAVV